MPSLFEGCSQNVSYESEPIERCRTFSVKREVAKGGAGAMGAKALLVQLAQFLSCSGVGEGLLREELFCSTLRGKARAKAKPTSPVPGRRASVALVSGD